MLDILIAAISISSCITVIVLSLAYNKMEKKYAELEKKFEARIIPTEVRAEQTKMSYEEHLRRYH